MVALASGLGSGCQRQAVGPLCYHVEVVLDIPAPDYLRFYPMGSGHGDLRGWIDNYRYTDQCPLRVARLRDGEPEDVLCLHDSGRDRVFSDAGDLGNGLFLVASSPTDLGREWCFDFLLAYQLRDLNDGVLASFSSSLGLLYIVRQDRFLGVDATCGPDGPLCASFERALYLVSDDGQVLWEHPGVDDCVRVAGIDPFTRDYFLKHGDGSFSAHDADGGTVPLLIGDERGCGFVGAQAGVQAFICQREDKFVLVVGQSAGPISTAELEANGRGALGGQGTIIALALETNRLVIYRHSQNGLEGLWHVEPPETVYSVVVGREETPLIGVYLGDYDVHVFDLNGHLVLRGNDLIGAEIGEVGGYVTLYGGYRLRTYQVTQVGSCGRPGASVLDTTSHEQGTLMQ